MTRFAMIAAALLASTSAFAGDVYNFKIGGQSIHVEQPRNCNSASCAVISIPGIYEQNTKRKRARDMDDDQAALDRSKKDIDTRPAPTDSASIAPAPAPVAPSVTTAPEKSLEPANGNATPSANSTAAVPQAPARSPAASSGGLAAPVVASATPVPVQPAATSVGTSPLGLWFTEEKEGKVRIEDCGGNLCGYSVDDKTNANGEKVLVNMKPGKDKWSGKIHDPKSGSNYESTIAMKGSDRLRVQGCAFGGMFCGGQTWTRAN